MSKSLKLADDLTLPLSAVTETFGVLAARGAGKSNLAAVMAEQMAGAGLPFVVVDPIGSWFGLRAGADGQKNGGLPIPIFGGRHGDVPLERHGGEMLADLVVSKRLSWLLRDVVISLFEEQVQRVFVLHKADLALTAIAERAKAEIDAVASGWVTDVEKRRAIFIDRLEKTRVQKILDKVDSVSAASAPVRMSVHPPNPKPETMRALQTVAKAVAATVNGTDLGKCERAILTVLANQPDGCESGRLTLLTGYRYSGGFKNSLSTLRQAGFMLGDNTGVMVITPEGRSAIGPVDPLPRGDELGRYWLHHSSFGKSEQAILSALLQHPKGLTAADLCRLTGYQYSGGFKNSLSNLRTAGVLVGKNTETMRASEELFG